MEADRKRIEEENKKKQEEEDKIRAAENAKNISKPSFVNSRPPSKSVSPHPKTSKSSKKITPSPRLGSGNFGWLTSNENRLSSNVVSKSSKVPISGITEMAELKLWSSFVNSTEALFKANKFALKSNDWMAR